MRRMGIKGGWWSLTVWVVLVALNGPAHALYLDDGQNFQVRARVYTRFSLRTENSSSPPGGDTTPVTKAGQMVEHRNFYNPEVEGKLTSYVPDWLNSFRPDDLSFRFAAWGFYDGLYDYGPSQFWDTAKKINADWPNPTQVGAFQLEGPSFEPGTATNRRSIREIFPGVNVQKPRNIYGSRQRVNELYLNYSKGPVFVRIGKQAISWGESDTVALLDQNNPFDLSLAVPGLFQSIDEARIPLWTVRTSVTLFETLGPFSSGFIEAYWVPGDLDVNTGTLPFQTASPYAPPQQDPQQTVNALAGPLRIAQFVLLDHVPRKRFESSRWGFRLQTLVNRSHTVSSWVYTTFPSSPAPLSQGLVRTSSGDQLFVTETVHDKLTTVIGLADTFFVEPLDSIIRAEVEFFNQEPAFTPEDNLGINQQTAQGGSAALGVLRNCSNHQCRVPKADFLRWELGLDRFFFLRAINPSNSFLVTAAVVGSWNMDEGRRRPDGSIQDFRYYGQRKEGSAGNSPDDFVQLKRVEAFGQVHLQTDYMHGRLTPGVTYIQNVRGTYALNPTLTYRLADWLLLDLAYIHIGGEFQQIGFFRDRDQISTTATLQLN